MSTLIRVTYRKQAATIIYQQRFAMLRSSSYVGYMHVFGDMSKKTDGVGSAAIFGERIYRTTLSSEASIFSAEVHSLFTAVYVYKSSAQSRIGIFSESLSSQLLRYYVNILLVSILLFVCNKWLCIAILKRCYGGLPLVN